MSNAESREEHVEDASAGVVEELVDKPRSSNGIFWYIAINFLAIFGEMWFLTAAHDPRRASQIKELRVFLQET